MAVAKLFSRLDYTVSVKYGDSTIQIPARAFGLKVGNPKILGELPSGITLVEEKGGK